MPLLKVIAVWKLVRGALGLVTTLLLALVLLGALVIGVLTSVIGSLSPSPWGGSGGGGSALAGEIPAEYLALMQRASEASCGLPWEVLAAIARVESNFTPTAVGPALPQFAGTEDEHARGMMQFLPSTYRLFIPRVDAATGKGLGPAGIHDA